MRITLCRPSGVTFTVFDSQLECSGFNSTARHCYRAIFHFKFQRIAMPQTIISYGIYESSTSVARAKRDYDESLTSFV